MEDRGAILLMGKDMALLDTRSLVLKHAGFTVIRSTAVEDTKMELTRGRIALLLLCHTLSTNESFQASMAASSADPRTIAVHLVTIPDSLVASDNILIHQMCGPQRLVEMVQAVLS